MKRSGKTWNKVRKNAYTALAVSLVALGVFASYKGARLGYGLYRQVFPNVGVLRDHYPVFVRKSRGVIYYKLVRYRPSGWKSLSQISPKAIAAVLASEDGSFWRHGGYSAEAIRAAIEYDSKPGNKIKRGGSTITQQVVKNVFLSPEKTFTRKIRELLLAVDLERKVPKSRILEIYLNIAEWGPDVYGIEAASQHYFSKSATDLSARDGAILAFMLPNPTRYKNSYRDGALSDFGGERVSNILYRLWKTGKITDDEYSSSPEQEEPVSSDL